MYKHCRTTKQRDLKQPCLITLRYWLFNLKQNKMAEKARSFTVVNREKRGLSYKLLFSHLWSFLDSILQSEESNKKHRISIIPTEMSMFTYSRICKFIVFQTHPKYHLVVDWLFTESILIYDLMYIMVLICSFYPLVVFL